MSSQVFFKYTPNGVILAFAESDKTSLKQQTDYVEVSAEEFAAYQRQVNGLTLKPSRKPLKPLKKPSKKPTKPSVVQPAEEVAPPSALKGKKGKKDENAA